MRFLFLLTGVLSQDAAELPPAMSDASGEPIDKNTSPVTRVVNLIKELRDRITEDEKRETKVYEKYSCWCDKTIEDKTKIIAQTKEDITEAERVMKENKAKAADAAKKN